MISKAGKRDRTDSMGTCSRPMTELLSRRSGLMRWSLAGALGLTLHGMALWWLIPTNGPAAAVAVPEAVVMIDLPPEPQLPPLESVEQAAVEKVVEAPPEELAEAPSEPELAEVLPEPDRLETVEPVEELAETPPAPVETRLPEPEMLPPSEVAMPLLPAPPPEMVETAEVKPKPEPKKPEPKKPAPKKPPETLKPTPPVDAQAAGAGAGREVADALAAYRSSIRRAIVGKRRASDADGATGRAVVSLSIGRDGSIVGLAVGGAPAVTSAAERLVRRVGSFPPVPQTLDAPFKVTVPIEFKQE